MDINIKDIKKEAKCFKCNRPVSLTKYGKLIEVEKGKLICSECLNRSKELIEASY